MGVQCLRQSGGAFLQAPPKEAASIGMPFVSPTPAPLPTGARVHVNQSRTPGVLSHSAQKVGYFLKPVAAFFFHEKKVSLPTPTPWEFLFTVQKKKKEKKIKATTETLQLPV